MKRQIIKIWARRVFVSFAAILVILCSVLAIHIYQVSNKPKGGVDGWQMARIDFKQPVDSSNAQMIRTALHQEDGIKHSYFNLEDGTLVYAFDPAMQQSNKVFKNLVSQTGITAEPFVVSEADMANGCPIIDKSSITYRISSGLQKLFQTN